MPDILEDEISIPDSENRTPPGYEPANAETPAPAAEPEEVKEEGDVVQEESAPSDDDEEEEDTGDEDTTDEQPKKPKGVQKRIDELTRQRYEAEKRESEARAEKEYWRQQAQGVKPQEQVKPQDSGVPRLENYESYEDFVSAISEYKAEQKFAELTRKQQMEVESKEFAKKNESFGKQQDEARKKYSDYDAVALAANVPISPVVGQLIMESDKGADIAYYLGKNPDIALNLSKMPAVSAAKEIGRLEVKFAEQKAPPAKKITGAPPPIKPVGGKERGSKDPSQMSTAEYREWRTQNMKRR